MSRFSQAISEGDGISVVPVLAGDAGALAALAEEAGAEAVAVANAAEVEAVRAATNLPVLLRSRDPGGGTGVRRETDADACVLVFESWADHDELEEVYASLLDAGVACVVDVRDEEELEDALERLDPEIVLISERDRDRDEDHLERTLDLLPDVPAGKLVVSEALVATHEQALALERAGVDAILVAAPANGSELARMVEELVRGPRPAR